MTGLLYRVVARERLSKLGLQGTEVYARMGS